jgi:thiamine biosynthesis lipoprotein
MTKRPLVPILLCVLAAVGLFAQIGSPTGDSSAALPPAAPVAPSQAASAAGKRGLPQMYEALGTVCTINLYDGGTAELYDKIRGRLAEIETLFSMRLPDSEISRINDSAGIGAVKVSTETLGLVRAACFFAEKTNGAFDPTVGPLVKLWGFVTDTPRVPSRAEIAAVLPLVDWRQVQIDQGAGTVFLPKIGMSLDMGGIAKGYAADELVAIIADAGIRRAMIDLGGNIYVYGTKGDGSFWRVGIKNPLEPVEKPALRLDLITNSVVTSGAYERNFAEKGVVYHHILDPETGYPAKSGLISATVVSRSSLAADALSTASFVLGRDRVNAMFPQGFSEGDYYANFVFMDENRVVFAPILRNSLKILTKGFSFAR